MNLRRKEDRCLRNYFEKYREYVKVIKRKAVNLLGHVNVYVFGSVVEGDYTLSSDIDVLIVSEKVPKKLSSRARITVEILKEIGIFSPFEIHLVTPDEFDWYKCFIKKLEEI